MSSLVECFNNNCSLKRQSSEWFKKVKKQSFKKIRCRNIKKETETDKLLKLRPELIKKLKKCDEETIEEISQIKKNISEEISENNRMKVMENFEAL